MQREKILFICIHNSARSQMAEAWVNALCGERFEAKSAGLEPGKLNPLAVEAMREEGIDISNARCEDVADYAAGDEAFDYVVTVCDESSAERCPTFPGDVKRLHWGFADPSSAEGSREERLEFTRRVRDEIRRKIIEWCGADCDADSSGRAKRLDKSAHFASKAA